MGVVRTAAHVRRGSWRRDRSTGPKVRRDHIAERGDVIDDVLRQQDARTTAATERWPPGNCSAAMDGGTLWSDLPWHMADGRKSFGYLLRR